MGFLSQVELRPLSLAGHPSLRPLGLALGSGPHALEVAVVKTDHRPNAQLMRSAWATRLGSRAVPLLLVALYDDQAALCGPTGQQPLVFADLDPAQVERLCFAALQEPDRHSALRFLQQTLPQVETPLLGLGNEGLLATHELDRGVPRRSDWSDAVTRGRSAMAQRGEALLRALGFEIRTLDGPVSVLTARDTKVAVALFLDRSEALDVSSQRFSGLSPVAYALARADLERLPYVMVSSGTQLRLYPAQAGVGTGQRGRTETFVQVHLDLLREHQAGYLWLLFSADALRPGGTLEEILERSADYVADVSIRLRDRIYGEAVPRLAEAIAHARQTEPPTASELATTYLMALTVLFRLLFVAYAEDQELLPYRSNNLYRDRSLKKKAHELRTILRREVPFGADTSQWEEVTRLFEAVDRGKPEWGVPPYNGGLFAVDPAQSAAGAALQAVALRDDDFGPVLVSLLLEESPEGLGPVDFRSLGVREFGTIYEGLLESELSVAATDLAVDASGQYSPAPSPDQVDVRQGQVYLHNASGARKATGSYYTKSFVVNHLLDHALEPALDDHLDRLKRLDERAAGEAFFDLRVVDIAMGSGHFLVAAVDRIERRLSTYLAERPLPAVIDELERLRARATAEVEKLGGRLDIDDTELLRRQIARRCIYGVDLNPIAVELARLSLWIHTFVPGLPLSLLDQNIVVGNSLVGIATIEEATEVLGAGNMTLFSLSAEQMLGAAQDALSRLGRLADADAAEIGRARQAYAEAREALRPTEALFDVLAASRLDQELGRAIAEGAATHWAQNPSDLLGSEVHQRALQTLEAIPPFHFPVAFPQVFLRDRRGFDVILGNPPWEEATLEEDRFWTRYQPGLQALSQTKQEALKERLRAERPDLVQKYDQENAKVELLRQALTTGPFPGMGTGDPDLYKAFAWRFWHLAARPGGRIGVVLPRSALMAKGSGDFRQTALANGHLLDLTFLLNSGGWVFDDAEPRYTIALTSLETTAPGPDATLPLRGPYRSLERFRTGVQQEPVRFPASDVLDWTDTAALPLLPTEESAEVFAQLRKAPRLDLDDRHSWRARPYGELHATNDKDLMLLSEQRPEGFWPVYKGESFDIWQPDTGTYYAWADPDTMLYHLQAKRERASRNRSSPFSEFDQDWVADPATLPCLRARVVFRDVSRATDTRTVRAALIPPDVVITNKGPYFLWPRGDCRDEAYLLGVLCSLPLDWYARRFVETTLNFHILNPFPVPRPARDAPLWRRTVALAGRLACPDERFAAWAEAVGVEVDPLDQGAKDDMVFELDAVVAHLYGLSEAQLAHVLETFHEGWDYQARLNATLAHYRSWEKRR